MGLRLVIGSGKDLREAKSLFSGKRASVLTNFFNKGFKVKRSRPYVKRVFKMV